MVLASKGYDFKYVNNGKEGLKIIREQKFDVVLLDVAMPEFSGADVVNELYKDGTIKKQNIILFTASSITDSEIREIMNKGVRGCLRKPVNLNELSRSIEILLKK